MRSENAEIIALIEAQPEWFELNVISACARSLKFYNSVKQSLCVSDKKHREENDFALPCDNLIYRALKNYRVLTAGRTQVDVVPPTVLQVTLMAMVANGDVAQEHADVALQRLPMLYTSPIDAALPILENGVGLWITKTRTRKAAIRAASDSGFDPEGLAQDVASAQAAGRSTRIQETRFNFGAGMASNSLAIERIQSGIVRLDTLLGGGFGMSEMALIIGSTGAGKTVFACQLAAAFAMNGIPGVLVTTEQGHEQLEPRIISNRCKIPFAHIKDGIDLTKLSHDQAAYVKEVTERLSTKLMISDWIHDRSKTAEQDLVDELRHFENRHGQKPKWLIFDWLGGALGSLSNSDLAVKRGIIQRTADKLASIANDEKIAVLATIQGNIVQCKNNMKVDSTCIMECKSAGAGATSIIGISQLQESVDDLQSGAAEAPYRRQQYLYISKARKGTGGVVHVRRSFEFQKYDNYDSSEDSKP